MPEAWIQNLRHRVNTFSPRNHDRPLAKWPSQTEHDIPNGNSQIGMTLRVDCLRTTWFREEGGF
jgi:hypothetical protein